MTLQQPPPSDPDDVLPGWESEMCMECGKFPCACPGQDDFEPDNNPDGSADRCDIGGPQPFSMDAIDELRAAGGDAWDKIEDPAEYLGRDSGPSAEFRLSGKPRRGRKGRGK